MQKLVVTEGGIEIGGATTWSQIQAELGELMDKIAVSFFIPQLIPNSSRTSKEALEQF